MTQQTLVMTAVAEANADIKHLFADALKGAEWELLRAVDSETWPDIIESLTRAQSSIARALVLANTIEKAEARNYAGRLGYDCVGCETVTLSRCMRCHEPSCGDCLVTHTCAPETGGGVI